MSNQIPGIGLWEVLVIIVALVIGAALCLGAFVGTLHGLWLFGGWARQVLLYLLGAAAA